MLLGGLLKTSLSDFPGRVSAVVFVRGCNWRCPYCHNPDLVRGAEGRPWALDRDEVLGFLSRRLGRLGGVVVSGGEPTLQADLPAFLRQVKEMGNAVKLDTNGSRPRMLRRLLEEGLVDHVALDVKAPPERILDVAGRDADAATLRESIALVIGAGIEHEIRMTVAAPLVGPDDVRGVAAAVAGARRLVLQPFVPGATLVPGFGRDQAPLEPDVLRKLAAEITAGGLPCRVRPSSSLAVAPSPSTAPGVASARSASLIG